MASRINPRTFFEEWKKVIKEVNTLDNKKYGRTKEFTNIIL